MRKPPPRNHRAPERDSSSDEAPLPPPRRRDSYDEFDDVPTEEVPSTPFRFEWLKRQPGVVGYAVRELRYPWHTVGEVTADGAEHAWYLRDLARKLEPKLGFEGFSRFELIASHGTTLGIEAPGGVQLVLAIETHTDIAPLLRTLGVA